MFRILCPELAGHLGYDTDGEAARVATLEEAEVVANKESRGGAVLVQIVDVETDEVVRAIPQTGRVAARPARDAERGGRGPRRKKG
jgi:hypothetical protein